MYVAELWRYPVKSMAGERLRKVNLTPLGLDGDRIVHVENARGRVVTARTHPKLLGHRAVLDAQGEPDVKLADLVATRDVEIDVSLQQPHAHLAHGVRDVRLRDLPVTAKILENILQFI